VLLPPAFAKTVSKPVKKKSMGGTSGSLLVPAQSLGANHNGLMNRMINDHDSACRFSYSKILMLDAVR